MKNFDWKEFKTGWVAVHLDTYEKWTDFLHECNVRGFKWASGEIPHIRLNFWNEYETSTCVQFECNAIASISLPYCKAKLFKIIEWEIDENELKFTKADLKTGMCVTLRNGEELIVLQGVITRLGIFDYICNENFHYWLHYYTANLKHTEDKLKDIIKVELLSSLFPQDIIYGSTERKLIWKRKELKTIEVTLEEIAHLKGCAVEELRIKE